MSNRRIQILDISRASPDERAVLAAYPDVICTEPEAFSYKRVSTGAQLLGDGPRRQTSGADDAAKKLSLPLNTTLGLNDALSAYTGDNLSSGTLFVFITLAKFGRIAIGSCLILDALDRFSRDEPLVAVGPYRDLLMAGIDIFSCSDNRFHDHKSKGMDSVMMLIISLMQFGTANQESSNKSFRINESWIGRRKEAVRNGKPMTTLCPGWLEAKEIDGVNTFVPIKHRVEIVQQIFEMAAGGAGKRTIARRFADTPTWGRGKRAGRTFYESFIHKLLNDRRVLGEFTPGTNPKEKRGLKKDGTTPKREWRPDEKTGVLLNYYPRIISDELWWRVRYARDKHKGMGGGNPNAFRSLFRGLAFCGACSGTYRKPVAMAYLSKGATVKAGHDKLICSMASRRKCNHTFKYPYYKVEIGVLFSLEGRAGEMLGKANQQRAAMEREAAIVRKRLDGLRVEQDRWTDAMSDVKVAPKAIVAKISELEAQIEQVAREAQSKSTAAAGMPIYNDVGKGLTELHAVLKKRTTAEERRLLNEHLRRWIKKIEFFPAEGDSGGGYAVITYFDQDPDNPAANKKKKKYIPKIFFPARSL